MTYQPQLDIKFPRVGRPLLTAAAINRAKKEDLMLGMQLKRLPLMLGRQDEEWQQSQEDRKRRQEAELQENYKILWQGIGELAPHIKNQDDYNNALIILEDTAGEEVMKGIPLEYNAETARILKLAGMFGRGEITDKDIERVTIYSHKNPGKTLRVPIKKGEKFDPATEFDPEERYSLMKPMTEGKKEVGAIPAKDARPIGQKVSELYGGHYDPATDRWYGIKGDKLQKAMAHMARAERLFSQGGMTHSEAVIEAGKEMGIDFPKPAISSPDDVSEHEGRKTAMKSMPSAKDHPERIVRDTETGKRYKSDGNKWVPIEE